MNIETRLKKLEAANRLYRVALAAALSLTAIAVFANAAGMGDRLLTPVEIRSPSEVVLRIDDHGVIEFWSRGRAIGKLDGSTVDAHKKLLPQHEAALRKVQETLRQQDRTIKRHEKRLDVCERHIAIDKRVR